MNELLEICKVRLAIIPLSVTTSCFLCPTEIILSSFTGLRSARWHMELSVKLRRAQCWAVLALFCLAVRMRRPHKFQPCCCNANNHLDWLHIQEWEELKVGALAFPSYVELMCCCVAFHVFCVFQSDVLWAPLSSAIIGSKPPDHLLWCQ